MALAEAERRVQAIATVHAALSQNVDESVDFDEVARTIVRMAGAIASTDHGVEVITTGNFGTISADQAQALATVLNELVANSVEHGLADRDGRIEVCAQREGLSMKVTVADDGVGFVPGTPIAAWARRSFTDGARRAAWLYRVGTPRGWRHARDAVG